MGVIETLNRYRSWTEYRRQLIEDLGSFANSTALTAEYRLKKRGWLVDGSLIGADFYNANWEHAILPCATLNRAYLGYVKAKEANLYQSDLSEANLWRADFREVNLKWANLGGALLAGTDFRGANLESVNLARANLRAVEDKRAGLLHVVGNDVPEQQLTHLSDYRHAIFDENTILPDGTKWNKNTDPFRFTNPHHDKFWTPSLGDDGHYPWWVEGNERHC